MVKDTTIHTVGDLKGGRNTDVTHVSAGENLHITSDGELSVSSVSAEKQIVLDSSGDTIASRVCSDVIASKSGGNTTMQNARTASLLLGSVGTASLSHSEATQSVQIDAGNVNVSDVTTKSAVLTSTCDTNVDKLTSGETQIKSDGHSHITNTHTDSLHAQSGQDTVVKDTKINKEGILKTESWVSRPCNAGDSVCQDISKTMCSPR